MSYGARDLSKTLLTRAARCARGLRRSGLAQAELGDPPDECAPRDPEQLGGLGLVAAAAVEGVDDALPLHRLDRGGVAVAFEGRARSRVEGEREDGVRGRGRGD